MSDLRDTALRFPIGKFLPMAQVSDSALTKWIGEIEALPDALFGAVQGLTLDQLDTPYRPGGWTVRQVVHHVADSHINSYVRYRLALTEDSPVIKTYREAAWAELWDAKSLPVEVSLDLLRALHQRWVVLLRSMTPDQFARTFTHPENGTMRLDVNTGLYAWHGRHHTAHITRLRDRNGW